MRRQAWDLVQYEFVQRLLPNLENEKMRSVPITSEQAKCEFKGIVVEGKEYLSACWSTGATRVFTDVK